MSEKKANIFPDDKLQFSWYGSYNDPDSCQTYALLGATMKVPIRITKDNVDILVAQLGTYSQTEQKYSHLESALFDTLECLHSLDHQVCSCMSM